MAITFPLPFASLPDLLRVTKSRVYLQRFDEQSGGGDGRIWSAQLAPPLWAADMEMADCHRDIARRIDTAVESLDGSRGTFMFSDPSYTGPASGVRTGLGAVKISGIRTDRGAIGLSGLPANFVLSAGDYLSISHAGGRVYFGRFAEGGAASGAGVMAQKELRPYLPLSIANGATVELVRPAFKAFIPPRGYTPYTYDLPHGEVARGGRLSILQKP